MFVSEDEARARLSDSRNIFAEPPAPSAPSAPVKEEEVVEDEEDEDFELPALQALENFDDLDAIIEGSHRAIHQRASYKGKREAQKAIGEVESLLGPTSASSMFGLSTPQAFAYGEGLRSSNQEMGEVPGLKAHLNEVKSKLALTASKRLKSVLKNLNSEKISAIQDPMKLSSIGKDMAQIVDRLSPKDTMDFGAHLHIYAPTTNSVEQYQIVAPSSRSLVSSSLPSGSAQE